MIKIFFLTIFLIILFLILFALLFVRISPQFGAREDGKIKKRIESSPQFADGRFHNLIKTSLATGGLWKILPEYLDNEEKTPKSIPPQKKLSPDYFTSFEANSPRLTWFGHSSVLLEIHEKKIFFDPMFENVPAPHPWLLGSRFNKELPLEIGQLPFIDAVIISHDHYDHLDYGTIIKMKKNVGKFYVPLGVGAHLRSWGVDAEKIIDVDWEEQNSLDDLDIIATPARHFSGRGLFDKNATLWCSWIIKNKNHTIFFGGDSGYDAAMFCDIGQKYGPFDIAMLESGQYNEAWAHIHMMPEETVQASIDLKAKLLMPIHWGSFRLSLHPWKEPVERLLASAKIKKVPVTTPQIGESVIIDKLIPTDQWWRA